METNFYPLTGCGGVSNTEPTWSAVRNAASGKYSESNVDVSSIFSKYVSGNYLIQRAFFPINTAPLPPSDTITSATLSFKINKVFQNLGQVKLCLVESLQASYSTLGTTDYSKIGTIELADRIDAVEGWNTFTLNAAGIALIKKGGISKFAVVASLDLDNTSPVDNVLEFDCTFAPRGVDSPYLTVTSVPAQTTPKSRNTHALNLVSASAQYATALDHNGYSVVTTGKITFEAWVKVNTLSNNNYLFWKGASGNHEYNIIVGDASGKLSVAFFSLDGNVKYSKASIASAIATGQWYHIAIVLDDSGVFSLNNLKIYINGIEATSTQDGSSRSLGNGTASLNIGRREDTGVYASLLIDELRIWNTARTQSEIKEAMFKELVGTETGLQGYWKLNSNYRDYSPNANHLTPINSPVFSTDTPFAEYKEGIPTALKDTRFINDYALQGYWPLDNVLTDGSGKGNTLTNNNSVGFAAGKFNNGADSGLSNTNKSLTVLNNLGITNGAISMSCWVKLNAEISTGTYRLLGQQNSGTDTAYYIYYEYNGGNRRLAFIRNRNYVATNAVYYNISLGTSDWHYLTLTYDGSLVRGYINGVFIGSVSSSGNGNTADTISSFGILAAYSHSNLTGYSNAIIDDVAVFSRALSATEILELYAGENPDRNAASLKLVSSSSQYASIANASAPNLEISGSKTWECWFKPDSIGTQVLMGKVSGTAGVQIFYTTTFIQFYHNGTTTNTTVTYEIALNPGQWYHVAGVYDSANSKLNLYLNGILVSSVTASGSSSISNAPFYIGRNDAGNYVNGSINNARIWNVARTSQEIKDNMFADVAGQEGLQGNWKLNNNYFDSSGNANHLTPTNSPIFTTDTGFPTYRTVNPSELGSTTFLDDYHLKAYWMMENLNDSKSTNHLIGDTLPTLSTGKFGNAYDFDSSFDALYKASMNFVPFTGGGSFVAWINPDTKGAGATSDYGRIINGAGALFISAESGNNYKLRFYHQFGTQWGRWETVDYVGTYGQWTHVVVTYDNGSTANDPVMYVNGIKVALTEAVTPSGSTVTTNAEMFIGNNTNASGVRAWDGKLDDLAFFNRLLSPNEIFDLYTGVAKGSFIKAFTGIGFEDLPYKLLGDSGWVDAIRV